MSDKHTKAAAESRRVIYDGRAFRRISSHLAASLLRGAGAAERRHQHQPFIYTSYKSARPDLQHKVCQASWGGGCGGVWEEHVVRMRVCEEKLREERRVDIKHV